MKPILVLALFLFSTSIAQDYQPALVLPESVIRLRIAQWEVYSGIFRYDPLAYAYLNGKISAYQELLALLPHVSNPSSP